MKILERARIIWAKSSGLRAQRALTVTDQQDTLLAAIDFEFDVRDREWSQHVRELRNELRMFASRLDALPRQSRADEA